MITITMIIKEAKLKMRLAFLSEIKWLSIEKDTQSITNLIV